MALPSSHSPSGNQPAAGNEGGSEQGGTRPVLIISNDIGNKHSLTVIIAAITGLEHAKANLPTHIIVTGFGNQHRTSKKGLTPLVYGTNSGSYSGTRGSADGETS